MQQLAVKKDTVVEKAFIDFLVVNLDKKQWLASMKLLNPPVLKYAYVCSDHFTDEDYVRNHTLQSGLLQSTVNKVLKRDAFLEGLGTCEIGVHNLSHFVKKRNSHN